jgi:chaperone required for assembly of F1-ATPase
MKLIRKFVTVPDLKTGDNIQKFYKTAGFIKTHLGYQLTLDNRPINTPEKQLFVLPTEPLALSIASEWEAQGKFIQHHRMPLVTIT